MINRWITCLISSFFIHSLINVVSCDDLTGSSIGGGGFAAAAAESSSNYFTSSLEDDLQFEFKWPGGLFNLDDDLRQSTDILDIITATNEKYKCTIPIINEHESNSQNKFNKDNQNEPLVQTSNLLASIYTKKLCSYRIESYWIYELCHGQFVRQYHETKQSGKRVVPEEYYLGYYSADKQEPDYFKDSENNMIPNVHWKILDGQKMAMYAVKYTDGTLCEVLTNTPREITIFYACDENGNDNIANFEEISSCVYEMVVVTKWICSHPAYKLPEKSQKTISCYSVENSPTKPNELVNIENERATLRNMDNKVEMTDRSGSTFIIHYRAIDDDDSGNVEVAYSRQDLNENQNAPRQQEPSQQQTVNNPSPPNHYSTQVSEDAEKEMIAAFLNGAQCLTGGTGWWKYEVCFGKHVVQYHEDDSTKKRTNIVLGNWNQNKHIEWIGKHPNKRPMPVKSERNSVSLYYGNGDMCELTNKHRYVEVKLKCLRTKEKSHTVSLYLLEPLTCEYLLAIESAWLCDYVENSDLNGLFLKETDQFKSGADKSKQKGSQPINNGPYQPMHP